MIYFWIFTAISILMEQCRFRRCWPNEVSRWRWPRRMCSRHYLRLHQIGLINFGVSLIVVAVSWIQYLVWIQHFLRTTAAFFWFGPWLLARRLYLNVVNEGVLLKLQILLPFGLFLANAEARLLLVLLEACCFLGLDDDVVSVEVSWFVEAYTEEWHALLVLG